MNFKWTKNFLDKAYLSLLSLSTLLIVSSPPKGVLDVLSPYEEVMTTFGGPSPLAFYSICFLVSSPWEGILLACFEGTMQWLGLDQ